MGVARADFSKARPGTKFATELSQYNELLYQLSAVNTNIELESSHPLPVRDCGYCCTLYYILYTTTAVCLVTRACT